MARTERKADGHPFTQSVSRLQATHKVVENPPLTPVHRVGVIDYYAVELLPDAKITRAMRKGQISVCISVWCADGKAWRQHVPHLSPAAAPCTSHSRPPPRLPSNNKNKWPEAGKTGSSI